MRILSLFSAALLAGSGACLLTPFSTASAQAAAAAAATSPSAGALVLTLKAPASYSLAAPGGNSFPVTVTLVSHLRKPVGIGDEEPRVTYELMDAQKQTAKPMLVAFKQHGLPLMTPHFIRLLQPGESAALVSAQPLDVSAAKPGAYQLRADYAPRFGGPTLVSNWVKVRFTR